MTEGGEHVVADLVDRFVQPLGRLGNALPGGEVRQARRGLQADPTSNRLVTTGSSRSRLA
jgi:hypothetical protein